MFIKYLKRKLCVFLEEVIIPIIKKNANLAGTDEGVKLLLAKILIQNIKKMGVNHSFSDYEFKVFSQFGDDGIIQYLISNVKIFSQERKFVEFGVEDYRESNTKFLLVNNNWKGLAMEADRNYVFSIMNWSDYWKYDFQAVNAFVTRKNINNLFKKYGFDKDVGLLSIDVDGSDYWLFDSLTVVKPIIVIIEYNSVFGITYPITIPYTPKFNTTEVHSSNLYWGASLKAFYDLFVKRGYSLVGTDTAGNNAYFVRNDRLGKIKRKSLKEGYTESKYRESRDKAGNLTFITGPDRLKVMENLIVFNLATNRKVKIKNLFNLDGFQPLKKV